MFRIRALSFIAGLPLMLWVAYAGGWWLFGAVVLLALIALREWGRAVALTPIRPNLILGALFILALLVYSQFFALGDLNAALVFIILLLVAFAFISRVLSRGGASPLADIGVTVLTPLYLGFFFSFLLRLRREPWLLEPSGHLAWAPGDWAPAAYLLVLLFLACWFMDTGAFLAGRFIGGPKLAPKVSPGKTIAGFIGAIVIAALTVLGGFYLLGLALGWGLLLGVLLGVNGQLGDLSKSLVKREVGIKDFGLVFPAHGGILDRFDNVLFNAPLIFYFLKWLLQGGLG